MRRTGKILGWWVTVGLLLCLSGVAWASSPVERAHRHLTAWQMTEARAAIDSLGQGARVSGQADYLEGRYAFYMGDYEGALEHLDRALERSDNGQWRSLRELVASTLEVTEDYEKHVSPSGRFEIFISPGRDEVLLPYAFEALEAAYEAFGEELGYRPEPPVRVEIYPRATVLAQVSQLTEENIRTSGTIALCQHNRLMITSPRAVLRGYGWVDTLIHEYVHYVINQATTANVPIWMHEGLAKYLERRWRGPDEARLDAASERLLRRRMEAGTLIPFDAMHPSMALLPSQEDAAVAFAEVYTTMEYLRAEVGPGAFAKLLAEINAGHDARTAYARVLNTTWREFEDRIWPAYLRSRPEPGLGDDDEVFEERIVLQEDAGAAGNELEQVEVPEAREHIQLGMMMQARDRYGAAVVQYQKAAELLGEHNPVLQTRLARSLVMSGQADGALEALEPLRLLSPGYPTLWVELGRAYLAMNQYGEAREALREAARINPFNPDVHEKMARAYRGLNRGEEAEEARRLAALVRGR